VTSVLRAAALPVGLGIAGFLITGGIAVNIDCLTRTGSFCRLSPLYAPAVALDVPYVTTRRAAVGKMMDLAEVGSDDFVIDLGSGDGRILIAAARDRGASGLGVDIDPDRVFEARANARRAGVADRVSFLQQDLFETDISRSSVVTMYLLPEINLRLRPRLLTELRPGTRIVSHEFDMREWQPDRSGRVGGSDLHLWIVPAKVAGSWSLEEGKGSAGSLRLFQSFQKVRGSISRGGASVPIEEGRLEGDRIAFVADGRIYEGLVRGDAIEGRGWRAERAL
jgi:SAM-dependent methyltransferase